MRVGGRKQDLAVVVEADSLDVVQPPQRLRRLQGYIAHKKQYLQGYLAHKKQRLRRLQGYLDHTKPRS